MISLYKSLISGLAITAAPVGVGALRSDTKSQIVKSASWPTPDITGIVLSKIHLANSSSLKQDKSSIEPPPRAMIIQSHVASAFALFSAAIKDFGASAPCTNAGYKTTSAKGYLFWIVDSTSCLASPVAEVISAILWLNLLISLCLF